MTFGEAIGMMSRGSFFDLLTGEDGTLSFRAIPDPEAVYHMAQRAKEARP